MTKILRARDVAERLGCNVTTVYRWASSGAFPKQIRLSSALVGWREDEIESWIEGRERGAHLNPGNIERRAIRESGRKGAGA
jgi:prophage regulatory protein